MFLLAGLLFSVLYSVVGYRLQQCVLFSADSITFLHLPQSNHTYHSTAWLFVFTEAFMRILDGSVARRNLFLVTKQQWRCFPPSDPLSAPQKPLGQRWEQAGATPSRSVGIVSAQNFRYCHDGRVWSATAVRMRTGVRLANFSVLVGEFG